MEQTFNTGSVNECIINVGPRADRDDGRICHPACDQLLLWRQTQSLLSFSLKKKKKI